MYNVTLQLFTGEIVKSNVYNKTNSLNVTTYAGVSKNYLFRFTPVINSNITYYYVDEYYQS